MNEHDEKQLYERIRRLEDESEIRRLLMSYGPAADAGLTFVRLEPVARGRRLRLGCLAASHTLEAARWTEMLQSDGHQGLIAHGVAHFAGPLLVEAKGNQATALKLFADHATGGRPLLPLARERGAMGRREGRLVVEGPATGRTGSLTPPAVAVSCFAETLQDLFGEDAR